MSKKKGNSVVKKHNELIEAYAEYMDVRELRIIAQTAARITTKDKDFQMYQVPVKDIEPNQIHYDEIRDICNKLLKKAVFFEDKTKSGKRTFDGYSIFSRCKYVEGEGYILTRFDPGLKPYFLELKDNFTQFNIETLLQIPSTYSYRLYELLKQAHSKGHSWREFEIEALQEKLNINKDHAPSYMRWGNFKDRVLGQAQKHLRKYTDLIFTYKAWAEYGRRFTHIRFTIKKNPGYQQMSLPGMESSPKQKRKIANDALKTKQDECWSRNCNYGCEAAGLKGRQAFCTGCPHNQ